MNSKVSNDLKSIVIALALWVILLNVFLGTAFANTKANEGIKVVSSIKPLALLIQEIIKDEDQVEVLHESNQRLHATQLKPAQMEKIAQAEVIFYIDDSFESFVKEARASDSAQYKYIQLSETPNLRLLGLRKSGELPHLAHDNSQFSRQYLGRNYQNIDWHIWLNPDNAIVMLRKIRDELSKLRPDNQQIYQERYEMFSRHLIRYSYAKADMMMKVLDSPFFVLHDGLQYFEEQFGLQSKGIIIPHGQNSLSAQHLEMLRAVRAKYGVNIVVKEEQFSNQAVTTLAGDNAFKVINIDLLAQGSFHHYEDYISYTDAMAERIYQGLKE